MTLTLVTCFFDLGKREKNLQRKQASDYLKWAQFLYQLNIPLIIFTDPEYSSIISKSREDKDLLSKTHIIARNLEDMPYYKFLDRAIEARKIHPLFPVENYKDTPLFAVMNWSKLTMMDEAINLNPFSTSHFGWIDFGISVQANLDHIHDDNVFLYTPDKIKILQLGPILFDNTTSRDKVYTAQSHVSASHITGSKESFQQLRKYFDSEIEEALKLNYAPNEELLLLSIITKYPELFELYCGYYRSVFMNRIYYREALSNINHTLTTYRNCGRNGLVCTIGKNILSSWLLGKLSCDIEDLETFLDNYYISAYYVDSKIAYQIVLLYTKLLFYDSQFNATYQKHKDYIDKNFKFILDKQRDLLQHPYLVDAIYVDKSKLSTGSNVTIGPLYEYTNNIKTICQNMITYNLSSTLIINNPGKLKLQWEIVLSEKLCEIGPKYNWSSYKLDPEGENVLISYSLAHKLLKDDRIQFDKIKTFSTPINCYINNITNYAQNSLTLVTFYFDLHKLGLPRKRSYEWYKPFIRQLLSIDANLVIFTQNDLVKDMLEMRGNYQNKTHIIPMELEDWPYYKLLSLTEAIHKKKPVKGLDTMFCPYHVVLQWSKATAVNKAVHLNPFNSTHFAWIDIGAAHIEYDKTPVTNVNYLIENVTDKLKLLMLTCLDKSFLSDPVYFDERRYIIAGGHFMGNKENILWFCSRFDQLLHEFLEKGLAPIDEMIFPFIICEDPKRFEFYYGNYAEIIENTSCHRRGMPSTLHILEQCRTKKDFERSEDICDKVYSSWKNGTLNIDLQQLDVFLDEYFVTLFYRYPDHVKAKKIALEYVKLMKLNPDFANNLSVSRKQHISDNFKYVAVSVI